MFRGRSVAGVARREGLLLLARRKEGGSIGGKWELPGGKIDRGESPEEALVREFDEELRVKIRTGEKLAQTRFRHHGRIFRLEAFDVELTSESFRLTEHDETGWFTQEEAFGLDLADSDRRLLEAIFRR